MRRPATSKLWTVAAIKKVGKSRCAVLLQPNTDSNSKLPGVTLPRRAPVEITPGRGCIVSGGATDALQTISPTREA